MNLSVVERKTRLIGAILVERGLITSQQLREALELQAERGGLLGEIVTTEFGVSQVEVSQAIAEQLSDLEAGTGADSSPTARPQLKPVGPSADGEARVRIGDALLELGLVDRAQIDAALEVQRQSGERLGEVLVAQGIISRLELAGALSEHWASLTKLRGPGEPAPVQAVTSEASTPDLDALTALLEGLGAKLDAVSHVASGDADTATVLERVSAKIDELTVAPADELAGQVERLSVRLDELLAAVSSDRLGVLGEGQRREEDVLGRLVSELTGLREETGARLEAIAGLGGGDQEVAAHVEQLAVRLDELLAGELAGRLDQLSVKVDEVAAAVPAGRLEERIASLDEGQRREEDVLGRLVSELAGLREETGARLEAIAGSADGGDGELAGQVERLAVKVDELAAAVPAGRLEERIASLDEGQRREEDVLGRLVSELAGLREETGARLEAIAGLAGGDQEVAAHVERLAVRFDELQAAVSSDQLGVLGDGQRRGEEILAGLVVELAGLREEMGARLEAIAGLAGGDQEVAAHVERLAVRFDELQAAVSSDQLGVLGDGQRRGEEILAGLVVELAGLREETGARFEALAGLADGGDGELAGQVERLAVRFDELLAGELAVRLDQLSVKVDEVAAAVPAGRLEERIASLDEGQRREEDVLGRLVSELAGLREETGARLEAVAALAGGDQGVSAQVEGLAVRFDELLAGELGGRLEQLAVKVDELAAAVPAGRLEERIASLDEGQRREEDVLGRVVAEMAALREDAGAMRGESESVTDGVRELAAQVERLSTGISGLAAAPDDQLTENVERLAARFDELVRASDQMRSLGEGQRRGEEALDRLVSELAGLREETGARLEAIAGSADGGDGELAGQVERLAVKVDELAAAVPAGRLEERIASLDEGQRREEDVLGRVVAEMAALREDAGAMRGESESVTDGVRELAAQVERLSTGISGLAAAPDDQLTENVERLAARFDELVRASDQMRSLGEGQRRGEEALDRLVSEFASLRDQTDARLGAIASAEAAGSQLSTGEFEALVGLLEGVGAGLEERGAARDRELAARVDGLSAKLGELSAGASADQLADRIDALADAQRRTEGTLERLLAELALGREPAKATPGPAVLVGAPSDDGRREKKTKKKKKKKKS